MDAADALVDRFFSWVELQKECADKLDKLADELEETQKNVNTAKVVGSSLSVGGAAAMTAAGVATMITGGAALPVIAMAGGAASWAGLATDASCDVVNLTRAEKTSEEAEEVVEKIENLHEEIDKLLESLKKEFQKKEDHDDSCSDDHLMESILREMAKRNGLIVDDTVSLKKILEDHVQCLKPVILSFFSLEISVTATVIAKSVRKLLTKGGTKAAKGVAKSVAGKTAGKAVGRMAGGILGLLFSVPELIENWNNMDICETEASKSLKENAKAIRTESENMKKDLQEILNVFRRLAKVKDCIDNRTRSSDDKKELIEFAVEHCKDEDALQWLRENSEFETFFKLIDLFRFLTKKKEEKKLHSNNIDITFVAHGSITDSMISANCLLPLSKITDVVLYSPWNCAIDAKVAYGVATGLIEPQHRVFSCETPDQERCCCCHCRSCRNKKVCEVPDADHQPTKRPDEWNSMTKAGDRKIPNIMLRPLRQRKDGAWKNFEILKDKYCEPEGNRIIVPFILPGRRKEEVPFFVVSLALSQVLLFSRFQATLHLTACLGKISREIKIDEDTLKEQYACTIDSTRMTSSQGKPRQKNKRLFKAFKVLFG
ncbi:uncharacterized protein LOC102079735 isoform X1 [Oreochromis niloticus]|uniref:uncharacterized protein LOC102079735 isoform X1 n=1 Tax=Oreochromis niloticus TaxID=8128 RepID=UPI000393E3F5|nr:uncharacterized protein LOC102079735 isoform X1 [Oreochromis niloticus]XP_019213078.1 uncharacterized protein LOC102079735 isoform X1 [Oreochromis niloticus]XP_025762285.1 uncharacterized protein LOC102079735 isoform X1 [Oreochromis niloticus]XP_025762286.1 uncharacterized protein LOC102079735 isoform X1 [Oreochromis niloticus]CAI5676649.1 unnamed protein product [Mustela putorius furo]